MAIKTICFLVSLRIMLLASTENANENQMNNEYYDRPQCVRQELVDIRAEFTICTQTKTQLDCALADEEINSRVIVSCGEEIKNVQKTIQNTNN